MGKKQAPSSASSLKKARTSAADVPEARDEDDSNQLENYWKVVLFRDVQVETQGSCCMRCYLHESADITPYKLVRESLRRDVRSENKTQPGSEANARERV